MTNAPLSIKAAVLHGVQDIRTESRTIPAPGPNEVQVSVRATGICGSDQHYYRHYRNGDILVREPMALGHESAGVVEAVGEAVAAEGTLKPGDRVALEVGLPCETCRLCKSGKYNLCREMRFRGSAKIFPHFEGTLQDRINHPAKMCHKLPENVSLVEGALLEPLSVAIHGVRRASLKPGARALVVGAGAVGLLVAAMLHVLEAKEITIADIEPTRVDFAVKHGFAHRGVVVPRRPRPENPPTADEKLAAAKETAALFTGSDDEDAQFDVAFECTGVEACVQAAIYSLAPASRLLIIGMGQPVQTFPLLAAALREVDIVGVFRYCDTYPYGIELLSQRHSGTGPGARLPDISSLATHNFLGLDNVSDAFSMAGRPTDDEGNLVIKVIIET